VLIACIITDLRKARDVQRAKSENCALFSALLNIL
jgi:hypothetical protein